MAAIRTSAAPDGVQELPVPVDERLARSIIKSIKKALTPFPFSFGPLPPFLSEGSFESGNKFRFMVNGTCNVGVIVEASTDLVRWVQIGTVTLNGETSFLDSNYSPRAPSRAFYRARCGTLHSSNGVGYHRVTVVPGYTFIANQMKSADSTVAHLLPNMPAGTKLGKWNEATQANIVNSYGPQGWTIPTMTLNPGEGGSFYNPTGSGTLTFIGEIPQGTLKNPIPAKFSIRSSMVPQAGRLDTVLGFTPSEDDLIYRWDTATQSYQSFTFTDGAWDVAPVIGVGESFWVRTVNPKTWTRTFSVW